MRQTIGGSRHILCLGSRLGEVVNALIDAGMQIKFLHEFPYAAWAKFPFMEQGEDGWRRLPPHQHGTIPFLFSLQAPKPD